MPRNEDGELELILGNRQLLSVFFIMMILLGVFFTVGYIVGSNSGRVMTVDTGGPVRADSKPIIVDSPVPKSQEPPPARVSESAPQRPITTAAQQPAEPPAKAKAEPEPETPSPAAKAEKLKQERAQKETAKSESAKPEVKAGPPSEPAAGQIFLQLSATQRAEAEVMVDVLRKKGFHAQTSPVPDKPGLFRVLVGPLGDSVVGQTRAELQSSGFPGDKAIRKTF